MFYSQNKIEKKNLPLYSCLHLISEGQVEEQSLSCDSSELCLKEDTGITFLLENSYDIWDVEERARVSEFGLKKVSTFSYLSYQWFLWLPCTVKNVHCKNNFCIRKWPYVVDSNVTCFSSLSSSFALQWKNFPTISSMCT